MINNLAYYSGLLNLTPEARTWKLINLLLPWRSSALPEIFNSPDFTVTLTNIGFLKLETILFKKNFPTLFLTKPIKSFRRNLNTRNAVDQN